MVTLLNISFIAVYCSILEAIFYINSGTILVGQQTFIIRNERSLETTDNPFEGNESLFLSTDSRATQGRKGKKHRTRFKIGEHKDPEIQAAIDKGLAVKILYDSKC